MVGGLIYFSLLTHNFGGWNELAILTAPAALVLSLLSGENMPLNKRPLFSAIAFGAACLALLIVSPINLNFWGKLFAVLFLLAAIPRVFAVTKLTEISRIRWVAVWSAVVSLGLLIVIGFIYGQTPSASRLETLAYVAIVSACALSAISPIRIFADDSLIPVLSILGFIVALIFFLVIRPINFDIWGKLLVIAWMTAAFSRTYAEASDIFGWNLKHRG